MSARNGHRSRFDIARKARMHSRENIRALRKGFAAKESQPESAASATARRGARTEVSVESAPILNWMLLWWNSARNPLRTAKVLTMTSRGSTPRNTPE